MTLQQLLTYREGTQQMLTRLRQRIPELEQELLFLDERIETLRVSGQESEEQ